MIYLKKVLIILLIFVISIIINKYEHINCFLTENIFAKEKIVKSKKVDNSDQKKDGFFQKSVTIGKFTLVLSGCRLYYEGAGEKGVVEFPFPQPCRFCHTANGAVRVVNTGKYKTILVEGTKELENFKGEYVTFTRAIVISKTDLRLSRETKKGARGFPVPGQDRYDEKLFHILAADTVPITELEVKKE